MEFTFGGSSGSSMFPHRLGDPDDDFMRWSGEGGGASGGGAKGAFSTQVASDWVIDRIEKNNSPKRKTFDWDIAKRGTGGFRLTIAQPDQEVQPKERKKLDRDLAQSPIKQTFGRAETYYQALIRAEAKREDANNKILFQEERNLIWQAAKQSEDKQQAAWKLLAMDAESTSALSADIQAEMEDAAEGLTDEELERYLRPYDGHMKVEIEIMVERAPNAPEPSESSASCRDDESELDEDDDDARRRLSLGDRDDEMDAQTKLEMDREMKQLMAEVNGWEEKNAADAAAMKGPEDEEQQEEQEQVSKTEPVKKPETSAEPRMPYSHPCPQVSLLLSGTAHLLPDVERLSLSPSLPIPPPPSLLGRHKMKMKPRLPLMISSGRYRDELPFSLPEGETALDKDTRELLAEKYRTIELFAGTSQALGTMDWRRRTSLRPESAMENSLQTQRRPDSAPGSQGLSQRRFPGTPKIDNRPERYLESQAEADALDRLLCDELHSPKGVTWKVMYDDKLRNLANTEKKAKQDAHSAKWAAFGGDDPFK